ncbi:MAG: hypothetical protein AAGK05_18370 [Pseudomonadota bacterium]
MIAANAFLRRGFSTSTNVEEEAENAISPLTEAPAATQPASAHVSPSSLDTRSTTTDSDEAEYDDTALPSDFAGLGDRDTMSYVLGAMIHRLNCKDCVELLTDSSIEPATSSFIQIMTYDKASLLNPKDCVVDPFLKRLKPIMSYYEKNYHHKHIVKKVTMKFRLKSSPLFCTQVHCNTLMTYFGRMLLRVFCKEKNYNI